MRTVNETLNTGGDGLWTAEIKEVTVIGLSLPYVSEDSNHGELQVKFDTKTWDPNKDGLIYTDKTFLAELKDFLSRAGYSTNVGYSEAGMQGDDYVSLDVDGQFINSWKAKFQ